MGKIIEQKITRFDKGMVNDPRIEDFRYAQLVKNFDIHTFPNKLVPFRSSESGDSAASTSKKQNFCVALGRDVASNSVIYALFGLGVVSGDTKVEILYKTLDSSAGGLVDGTWTAPSGTVNYRSTDNTNNVAWFELFVYYKRTGLIYGGMGTSTTAGTKIWAFYPNATTAFDNDIITTNGGTPFTFSKLAQGLVHSKDDILYIPYDNKIAKNSNGTWTTAALTLPSHLYITSICEYGNFLAIACAPLSGVGNSRVFLWDRDASNTVLTESIDWGEGNLKILEEIDGHLIGISVLGITTGSALTTTFFGKIIIRQYSGGFASIIEQFISTGNYVELPIFKQKVDSFLYFAMIYALNGTQHEGIWRIGRIAADAPFALSLIRSLNNDTSVASPVLKGFCVVGDYVFISYTTSGTFVLNKTDDTATYSATSTYDSQIFNLGDTSVTKKLLGTTIFTEALDGTESVVVAYRKDEDIRSGAAFTTISTHTTNNSLSHSAINIESSGTNLPEFKEIQFRLTTTLGSRAIVGFKFKAEIIDKDIY